MTDQNDFKENARAKKKRTLLAFVVAAGLLVSTVLLLSAISIDGNYTCQVLDSFPGNAGLVLKHGDAFIRGPDGELIPYGHYAKARGAWRLLEAGSTNDWWEIHWQLVGFDLINSTNPNIHYHFTRNWLP